MNNKLHLALLKPVLIPFLCSFMAGMGFIFFVQPRLEAALTAIEQRVGLVQSSWDIVAGTFGEEIDALKEGRFAEHVRDELASVRVLSDGDFRERATEFFQNASRVNFFGLGSLFSLDWNNIAKRVQWSEDRLEVKNQDGYSRTVIFNEVEQPNDDALFLYKAMEHGRLVLREFRSEGFSVDLPVQMQPLMTRMCTAIGGQIGSCELKTN
jgi:hypothetical protein